MSSGLTFEIFDIICTDVRHDLKRACAKGNRFRIDGEIDEKPALQIYQNNYVLDYSILLTLMVIFMVPFIRYRWTPRSVGSSRMWMCVVFRRK